MPLWIIFTLLVYLSMKFIWRVSSFYIELRCPMLILKFCWFLFFPYSLSSVISLNFAGLYLHAVTETKLVVDTSRGERLRINFDVTFPALACSILSLDAMDISGEQHLDVRHDIIKKRIDAHGNVIETRQDGIGHPKIEKPLQRHGGRLEHNETYCGSCYGAEASDDDCCNSCEEVREAYRKKGWAISNPDLIDQCKREGFLQQIKEEEGEGCNIYGFLDVNKVAGNFHFAPGKSFQQSNVHVHDLLAFQMDSFNISHKINRLAFGDYFPGVINPLDGVLWLQQTPNAMYQYFLKVVSTVFTDVNGNTIQSNQVRCRHPRLFSQSNPFFPFVLVFSLELDMRSMSYCPIAVLCN
ncbi:endoplasmic reticulum-Golgi intermediate compartment 3-like [Olea europaea subsp. europaea]|uniref:Endoplasmic reticulum-Golgi intermediate compartment 3-like n=1 Tax=Olea europaea subsp. europaea TaxID=158383 RepID=A0A8S0RS48_OLEEU|nr:endoplasmic reticulum-Golgi intermediate compartment 3-like [Olea europaea subsp. europaea]